MESMFRAHSFCGKDAVAEKTRVLSATSEAPSCHSTKAAVIIPWKNQDDDLSPLGQPTLAFREDCPFDQAKLTIDSNECNSLVFRADRPLDEAKVTIYPEECKAKLACGMPERTRANLATEVYDVSQFYHEVGYAQRVARSHSFMNVTLAVIAANAVYIGVDQNNNSGRTAESTPLIYKILDQLFCIYFVFEWITRFAAFKLKRNCLRDGWFKFDSFLVLSMFLETWLIPLILLMSSRGSSGVLLPTEPLRLLRLLRLSRMARLMRAFPELVTMVKGMQKATRAVASSLIMVTLLIYVFGIAVHMFMAEEVLSENYFSSVPRTMWSLLIYGTLVDSVGPFLTEILDLDKPNSYVALTALLLFVLLSAMTVLNMLIGVLCEVVTEVAQDERDEAAIILVKDEILGMLKSFDADNSGTITQSEMLNVMADPQAAAVLETLDVDVRYLLELQEMIYEEPNAMVPIEDVMELILRTRGSLTMTVSHMVSGHQFTRWSIRRALRRQQVWLERRLQAVFAPACGECSAEARCSPATLNADGIVASPLEQALVDAVGPLPHSSATTPFFPRAGASCRRRP
eukprot:TRINITY_DN25907_c0_g1_i1.p1 TRINITY_DN25907_c0_g1~~TRINITY_DN25907_c0_g1_i1.p1  ORF type:complete len:618 (-),score=99.35 TRINITY_DN25907_c0_g1_i1:62-1780(-)